MDAGRHPERTGDCLKQVIGAADRAGNLTRQLLAFSRKQVMQFQRLGLNDVIANLTKMLTRLIAEHIRLECHYGAGLPLVWADAGMIEQVLVNLVVNARDAMPRGGQLYVVTERVTLEEAHAQVNPEARPGVFVCLTVRDTGTGIASEHLPRIFEPFFTTKELGKGTGLGLATVYGIVKQHQGWVEVTSQPGAGTTFQVFMPAIAAPANTGGETAVEEELRSARSPGGCWRIWDTKFTRRFPRVQPCRPGSNTAMKLRCSSAMSSCRTGCQAGIWRTAYANNDLA
jgi:signal transduction histidine kinase